MKQGWQDHKVHKQEIIVSTIHPVMYVHVYTLDDKSSTWLFYDPTLHYFKLVRDIYHAILALVFLVIFVIIPTLVLTLYPFQFFQRFLSLFPLRWHFLHAFIDSFQGCYKDGTKPVTVDCWVAICTTGSIHKADPFCHLRINSDIHILYLCNIGLCSYFG